MTSPTDANGTPIYVYAAEVPPRTKPSVYPEPFASRMRLREKRQLGEVFGLTNFGVNLTRIAPGGVSALRHTHTKQDEFIYILEGAPLLLTEQGAKRLSPGVCAGFRAGVGNGHQLFNDTQTDVLYLEVGDRTPDDEVTYPDNDLQGRFV